VVGFRKINLFIIAIVCFIPFASFGDMCECAGITCGAGQFCDEYYNWGEEDPTYSCAVCLNGQVPNASCNGCEYCGPEYTLTCPGDDGSSAWSTIKCKVVANDCDGISGCTKYEACNRGNHGNKWFVVSDSCHMENGTCYSNQRNCSLFGEYNLLPVDGTQFSGVAEWVAQGGGYKWDVGNCTSRAENKEYAFTNCDRFSFHGIVRSQNRYIANVQSKITYTTEWAYCSKCKPGAVLTIMNSPTDGVVYRPTDIPGNWGGSYCWEPVHAPNYADGCEIDFSKPTGEAAVTSSSCTKSCYAGYATQEDGATSENDCEFDTSALFHDATGDFTLGNMTNCPTNGG